MRTVCIACTYIDVYVYMYSIWAAGKTAYQSQGHAVRHYVLCYLRQNPLENDVPRHQKSITRGFGTAPYVLDFLFSTQFTVSHVGVLTQRNPY